MGVVLVVVVVQDVIVTFVTLGPPNLSLRD